MKGKREAKREKTEENTEESEEFWENYLTLGSLNAHLKLEVTEEELIRFKWAVESLVAMTQAKLQGERPLEGPEKEKNTREIFDQFLGISKDILESIEGMKRENRSLDLDLMESIKKMIDLKNENHELAVLLDFFVKTSHQSAVRGNQFH